MTKPILFTKTGKPRKHSSCLDAHKDEIVKLLMSGMTKLDIARRFGVSKQTLFTFMQLNQIEHSLYYRLKNSERKIEDMFGKGITLRDIAKSLKSSQTSVSRKIKELKLRRTRSDTYNKPTILERYGDQIKIMFEKGFTLKAIADALGVHFQSIRNCIKQLGLHRNRVGKYAPTIVGRDDMLLKMCDAGIDTKSMARIFSCSVKAINYHLRRLGIKRDRHGRIITA